MGSGIPLKVRGMLCGFGYSFAGSGSALGVPSGARSAGERAGGMLESEERARESEPRRIPLEVRGILWGPGDSYMGSGLSLIHIWRALRIRVFLSRLGECFED